tara:strand:+ start:108 stop:443 length:336 start_codon:yes stop_codon:yes gene_type:complete
MAKWRQMWDEVEQKYKMVAIDKSAAARDGISLHAAFDPFVSPVDGSVISDRKQLREHNLRNNVVNTSEFGEKHWEDKKKERERLYNGEHTPAEKWKRKAEINEAINRYYYK